MNKDAVYVLEQPKHSIVTVVLVNSAKLPLSNTAHLNIDSLREISDLFFVFSDKFETRDVDIPKFANLYGACSYICGSGEILGNPIFTALAYCDSVFQKHYAYLITDSDKLTKCGFLQSKIPSFQGLALMGIQKPVFKIERLGPEELGEIYTIPLGAKEKSPWWKFWETNEKGTEYYDPQDRIWSTHKSPSKILFFKAPVIKAMIGTYGKKEFNDYVKTFSEEDLTYLFASYIKKMGIENIDNDIQNLEVNGQQ